MRGDADWAVRIVMIRSDSGLDTEFDQAEFVVPREREECRKQRSRLGPKGCSWSLGWKRNIFE